jgi:hypothetical protein
LFETSITEIFSVSVDIPILIPDRNPVSLDQRIVLVFHNALGVITSQSKVKTRTIMNVSSRVYFNPETDPDPSALLINLYGGSGATNGSSHIGDGSASSGKIGGLALGVLEVVIGDGGLDGILSKHGAVD